MNKTTTVTKEYDDEGRVVKETTVEQVSEVSKPCQLEHYPVCTKPHVQPLIPSGPGYPGIKPWARWDETGRMPSEFDKSYTINRAANGSNHELCPGGIVQNPDNPPLRSVS